MRNWIGAALVLTMAFAGGVLWAQPKNVQPPPQIISGADFGFKVDSVAPDGTVSGRIVVHQNGQWVDVKLTGGLRRLDLK
jgi:hypothetical protein